MQDTALSGGIYGVKLSSKLTIKASPVHRRGDISSKMS